MSNVAQIRKYDIANGLGVRTTVFLSGCKFNCPDCFNKEYQNFKYGQEWNQEIKDEILDNLSDNNVVGLSILGGEPFQNLDLLTEIVLEARTKCPDKNIWIWSGYKFDVLKANPQTAFVLNHIDVLVDGLFVKELKDIKLKFRGSSNQRVIDVKKSLEQDEVVLVDL